MSNRKNMASSSKNTDTKHNEATSSAEGRGNREQRTEMRELVYEDETENVKKEFEQLRSGTHRKYVKQYKKLKEQKRNKHKANSLWRDEMAEAIEREFNDEINNCFKDFERQSRELSEKLIADLNEKKKALTDELLNMKLNAGVTDQICTTPNIQERPVEQKHELGVPAPQYNPQKTPSAVLNVNEKSEANEI